MFIGKCIVSLSIIKNSIMMLLDVDYKIGDTVYLETDVDQQKRLVTGYTVRLSSVIYLLSCGVNESSHYSFEITEDVNVLITSAN